MGLFIDNNLLIIIFVFLASFVTSLFIMRQNDKGIKGALLKGVIVSLAVTAVIYFFLNSN